MGKAAKAAGVVLLVLALLLTVVACEKTTSTTNPGEPPTEVTWLSPGKVFVKHYRPGDRAEWPVTIYNSNYEDMDYTLLCEAPSLLEKGYETPPSGINEWVIFIDPTPIYKVRVEVAEDGTVLVGNISTSVCLIPEMAHSVTATVTNEGTELSWIQGEVAKRVLVRASTYRYPSDTEDGYFVYRGGGNSTVDHNGVIDVAGSTRYYSVWAEAVGQGVVRIAPRETKDVLVVLEVPKYEETPKKYEFLVVIQEGGQANVVLRLASRWMISS